MKKKWYILTASIKKKHSYMTNMSTNQQTEQILPSEYKTSQQFITH